MSELDMLKALTKAEHAAAHQPNGGAFIVPEQAAADLAAHVQQLGRIVALMLRKMDEMEEASARRVTVNHAQALALTTRIRERAAEICAAFDLQDKADAAAFRAAIKKAVLGRFGIRDLHDLPLRALQDAERMIDNFASISLVMERRRLRGSIMEGARQEA